MKLCPSDIRYSQDSIASYFRQHPHNGVRIGESLDDLLRGHCSVRDFPTITVTKKNNLWYSGDNRRLWVFKKAHELGKISDVPVCVGDVDARKFTTNNQGASIGVRGDPGGKLWKIKEKEHEERIAKEKELEKERIRKEKEQLEKERIKRLQKEREFELLIQQYGSLTLDPDENPFLKSMRIRDKVCWKPFVFNWHEKQPSPLWTGLKYNIPHGNDQNVHSLFNADYEFRIRLLSPSVICFTNNMLNFKLNRKDLVDHVNDLNETDVLVNHMTPLKVFFKAGLIVTNENEKLWIFKFALKLNLIDKIIVEFVQNVTVQMQACTIYTTAIVPFSGKTISWACACKLTERDTKYTTKARPSSIKYSIRLCSHMMSEERRIGDFLDKLLASAIRRKRDPSSAFSHFLTQPLMVVQSQFYFYTLENRKLWILKHLEDFGLCIDVEVAVKDVIEGNLLRHIFDVPVDDPGVKLSFDDDPGGRYWKTISWLNQVSPSKRKCL